MGLLKSFRKAVRTLFNRANIESVLDIDIAVSGKMEERLQTWTEMFEDRPPWKNPEKGMFTLNLPASVSSEIARLVTLELKSTVEGSPRADFLNEQYQRVVNKARRFMEYACAKGGIVLKPYVANGGIHTTVVQADDFFPTNFNSDGEVTGGVFTDYRYIGKYKYTRLEHHEFDGDKYVIRNYAYRVEVSDITAGHETLGIRVPLSEVEEWGDISDEVPIDGVEKVLFAYLKMPFANNIEPRSPLGVSCFARAEDAIRTADRQWSEILWEYEAGEAAVNVSSNLFMRDSDGKPILPAGRERLYRTFDYDRDQKLDPFMPPFRDSSLFNGMNKCLQRVEFLCGLAYGTLSDPSAIEKTATEIIKSNQRSYSTISDVQKSLQNAMEHLAYAMNVLASLYNLAPEGKYDITFEFDDSIVVDAEAERQRDLNEVRDGLMKKWEFRVKWYGETEQKAREMVGEENEKSDDEILDMFNEPPAEAGSAEQK